MPAEQRVEESVLSARMIVAVPPKPIAPLGDIDFLPGALHLLRSDQGMSHFGDEVLAGIVQMVPGGIVFVMPDPDGEVVIDPTPGEKRRQMILGRMIAQII